jgi:hypothetical protein
MSIEAMLIAGTIVGLLIGMITVRGKAGCTALLIIPVGMVICIAIWQSSHPENLRSTSALDFIFGPLWPSLGGLAGLALGRLIRWAVVGGTKDGG